MDSVLLRLPVGFAPLSQAFSRIRYSTDTAPGTMSLEALLGGSLLKQGTEKVPTSELLASVDHVMLYFSAHWYCPAQPLTSVPPFPPPLLLPPHLLMEGGGLVLRFRERWVIIFSDSARRCPKAIARLELRNSSLPSAQVSAMPRLHPRVV